jgi:hypothetical protein
VVQLEGTVTVGGTDFSDEVFHLIVRLERATVWIPPTGGNRAKPKLAGYRGFVTIAFDYSESDSLGIHAALTAALLTPTGEITFSGIWRPGAASPTNQKWSGTMLAAAIDAGGTPGEQKEQTQTYPAHSIVISDS